MKDLTIWLSVKIDEPETDLEEQTIFDDNLYIVLPTQLGLDDATKTYLMTAAEHLVKRALAEAESAYRPELEAKP